MLTPIATLITLALTVSVVFMVTIVIYKFPRLSVAVDVPYVGLDAGGPLAGKRTFQNDCESLLREGYQKVS